MEKQALESPEKPLRKRNKRKVTAQESAIRTDLLRLAPNKGKEEELEGLFDMTRRASMFFMDMAWERFLSSGKTIGTQDWRAYDPKDPTNNQPNPVPTLAGSSTLLQPLIKSVAGTFDGWLGCVGRTFSKRLSKIARRLALRLEAKAKGTTRAEAETKAQALASLVHNLRSINRHKAWTITDHKDTSKVMKTVGGTLVPVSSESFHIARRIFLSSAKRHALPNASGTQVEQTRGSARIIPTEELSKGRLVAISLEAADSASAFPAWLKVSTAPGSTTHVPILFNRAFHLRNQGSIPQGAGGKGPDSFPVAGHHDKRHNKKRRGRLSTEKGRPLHPLNPSWTVPEKIESVGIVRKIENGRPVFYAAARSQMRDVFQRSTEDFIPLVDSLGIDFGIANLMTLSTPLGGSRFVGQGWLKKHVLPVLQDIERLQAIIQSEDELRRAKIVKTDPTQTPERTPLESKRLTVLRNRLTGLLESFVGNAFNRIATEIRPALIVVENLDFQGCDLSASMNSLLTNCGRSVVDAKLKDLLEKFGIQAVRVSAAWTSQECSNCGFVHEKNRNGPAFLCLSCGHAAHADENASLVILKRKGLPDSQTLSKTKGGFSWEPNGTFPRVPQDNWLAMGACRNKPLLWFLWNLHQSTRNKNAGAPACGSDIRFAGIFPAIQVSDPKGFVKRPLAKPTPV